MNNEIINIADIDEETKEMLNAFVSESFDSLDSSEPLIEEIREGGDSETVNAIFRVFHTLKGLSGFFGMSVINRVTHEAETLLDIIRKNTSLTNDEVISVIYSTYDFLRNLITSVNANFSDESGSDEADDMILIIRDIINKLQNPPSESNFFFMEDEDLTSASSPESAFFTEEPQEETTPAINEQTQSQDSEADEFLSQFLEGAIELTETISNNLVLLEKDPNNTELVALTFGAVHSLKGNAGFMGFAEIEEIAMDMETILDSVRNHELDLNEMIVSILLSNLEMIISRMNISSGINSDVADESEFMSDSIENSEEIDINFFEQEEPVIETPTAKEEKVIIADIPEEAPKEEKKSSRPLELVNKPNIQKVGDDSDSKKQAAVQKKDIRVDTAKIDRLFDLVGELITIEAMVTNNPDIKGLNLPNFARSANMLNKITRELQEVTMSVRMMPLEALFNKMKRLVRDVSIKMNKKVDIIITGQETEMDKNIIDEIADPLVHLIRNSIDHGIEMPEERIAAGKNETGKVHLTAKYEGNEILITIRDDGKGMNKERILNKAIEKGLINTDLDKLSDKDIYKLIFEPGFSTAEKVTDISGRGVGMDVVKKNIEKLRGTIDLESKPGIGATVILRIPLTLAIIESMIFRIGESKFAMPILSVIESLKITSDKINRTMDGLELIKVRNDLLPVVRLHQIFDKVPDSTNLEDGLLVIIESHEKRVCLFVDEIIGQQQAVVKSMTDYIGKVPGLTGCMILGDGGIGLIVDIEGIVEISENPDFRYLTDYSNRVTA